jgi:hypothetical protein
LKFMDNVDPFLLLELRKSKLSCWIVTDLNGLVPFAQCKSDAGSGEFCFHVETQKVSKYWFDCNLVLIMLDKFSFQKLTD